MQYSMTFEIQLKFDYVPAEYDMGHLFQPERMELSDCNIELSDKQIALFEEQALKAFKAEKRDGLAARAYELYLEMA